MGFFDWLKKGREHSLPSILPDEIDPQKLQEPRTLLNQAMCSAGTKVNRLMRRPSC
jgi:hypothetical protein